MTASIQASIMSAEATKLRFEELKKKIRKNQGQISIDGASDQQKNKKIVKEKKLKKKKKEKK